MPEWPNWNATCAFLFFLPKYMYESTSMILELWLQLRYWAKLCLFLPPFPSLPLPPPPQIHPVALSVLWLRFQSYIASKREQRRHSAKSVWLSYYRHIIRATPFLQIIFNQRPASSLWFWLQTYGFSTGNSSDKRRHSTIYDWGMARNMGKPHWCSSDLHV